MSFLQRCQSSFNKIIAVAMILFMGVPAFAGEANLVVPKIEGDNFNYLLINNIPSYWIYIKIVFIIIIR